MHRMIMQKESNSNKAHFFGEFFCSEILTHYASSRVEKSIYCTVPHDVPQGVPHDVPNNSFNFLRILL